MCEHGNTEKVNVWIPPHLSHSGVGYWKYAEIDSCIAPIVQALQFAGIHMLGSCCGHGKNPGSIVLADGRELIIKETNHE